MLSTEEQEKIKEEIAFWDVHMFNICILKQIPKEIPNKTVADLLEQFKEEYDYHMIVSRHASLKRSLQITVH